MDERIEMQELYCHECGGYVKFPIDLSMDGKYVLKCPECKHEHCRYVHDGIISDERWDSRNKDVYMPVIQIASTSVTYSTTSSTSSDIFYSSTWGTSTATISYTTSTT